MTVEASVRFWHEEGWGVLDSPETPGGCWVFFGHIDHDGYRSLTGVASVQLDWEEVTQDGYPFRAVRVLVPGRAPSTSWRARPSGTPDQGTDVRSREPRIAG